MSERTASQVTHFSQGIDGVMIHATASNGRASIVMGNTVAEAIELVLDEVAAFDSTAETLVHIRKVQEYLGLFATEMIRRGAAHDASKLGPEEKPLFDKMTPKLKTLVYGSLEYKASLGELGVALKHHYQENSHHPEHYPNGIDGMTLMDLVEMFFDWKAASERGATKLLDIDKNADRFGLSPQIAAIMKNTAAALDWALARPAEASTA